jgi:hypothetical protein
MKIFHAGAEELTSHSIAIAVPHQDFNPVQALRNVRVFRA